MQNLMKNKLSAALLLVLAGTFVGCSVDARRARYEKRAEDYFKKGEYLQAEIEYRNVARLSKTLDPRLLARLTTIYYEQGRIMESFRDLTNAAALNPNDLELRTKVGTVWATFRYFKEAREEALFVLGKDPNHHEAKLLLADTAQKPEEIKVARQKINDILRTSGESWSARVALAELAMHEKQTNTAEKELQLAAKLDSKAPPLNVALAQLAMLRQQPQEAEKFLRVAAENSPARSPRRLLLAQFKMDGTNLAEAKSLLDKQLKEAPDYVPAWVLRGKIALSERDFAECSRIATAVLAWAPMNYDIRLLRARTLVLQEQPAKAIEEFQRLEALAPGLAEPKYEMAVAHVRNGASEEAIKKLDEALRLNPDYADAVILRAELKLRTGGADDAVAALIEFTKRHPENGRAFLVLANAYSATGRLDEALTIYRGLIQNFTASPEFRLFAGMILRRQSKPDEARAYFEEALKVAPAFALAAEQLVDFDLSKKDFDAAQRRVNEQLKLSTNSAAALMLQAKVSMAKRDLAGAESALTRAIQVEPTAAAPYSLLASIYFSSKEPQKALAQLESAIEKNPKNPGPHLLAGAIHESQKSYDKAKKAYEAALKLNPKFAAALNNLAYLLCEHLNQVGQALPHALKAHELSPEDPGATDTLAWIYYRQGEFARALPLLRESAARMPEQAEVQYHLAMALYTTDNGTAARSAFTNVIALDKTLADEKKVQRRIFILDLNVSDPKAVDSLESALKEDSNDFVAALKLGQAYERSGANEKARSAYERATKINPASFRPLVLLASLNADKLKDVPKALEAARTARKLAPNDPAIAGILGRISYRANDYPAALALLQEYSRGDKADAETLYDLALAYYAVGQSDEARANLASYVATARENRLTDARNVMALIDFQSGKGDAARAATIAEARLQQDPNDLPALMTLGLIARQSAKHADAAQKFERVIALSKNFPLALRHLAILYAEQLQNDQKAYEFGSKARQTFSNDPELAIALGKASYRRDDFQNAVRLLSEGVQERQTDPQAFFYLGMASHKLGKTADAKANLNRAIGANLASDLATEAKKVLASLK
jgi:tetratricopeptide (TPR) repeat protein